MISLHSKDSQESSPAPQFKASILWHSDFFVVQLSHPYMTTGKTIDLTRGTCVGNGSRGDGIPTKLFQIIKDVAVKVLHSTCQQIEA